MLRKLHQLFHVVQGCAFVALLCCAMGMAHAESTSAAADANESKPALSAEAAYIRNALVQQGETKGLDKSPQFRLLMSQFRKEQLAKLALEHAASAGMPDFTARAEELYQARLSEDYTLPLRLRVRVLEMNIPDGQEAAIRQQLAAIRADVQTGKLDFTAAVLAHSTDPEKHLTQGDSQWFYKGQKPDVVYDAALNLTASQPLSDVVVNRQTAYLLQFLERKAPSVIPFADAQADIVAKLAKDYREENQQVVLDKLKAQFQQTQTATSDAPVSSSHKVDGM